MAAFLLHRVIELKASEVGTWINVHATCGLIGKDVSEIDCSSKARILSHQFDASRLESLM
jgi:hypothetical protein